MCPVLSGRDTLPPSQAERSTAKCAQFLDVTRKQRELVEETHDMEVEIEQMEMEHGQALTDFEVSEEEERSQRERLRDVERELDQVGSLIDVEFVIELVVPVAF